MTPQMSQKIHRGFLCVSVVFLCLCGVVGTQAEVTTVSGAATQAAQRISLDLKGVDILDVLKLLSQKSGLNFVAGRNVSGRVTIFVNDVDVWDAFELIVSSNDLAYERKGGIITVMMARDYELIYGQKFQERQQNLIIPLKFAKAAQVATVLNQVKSTVGRVVADEATNTLIVTDVPLRLADMRELLKSLDRETTTHVYKLNYAEAEKLKEKVQELLSPVGTFTFDARTNTVIISDQAEVLEKTDRIIKAFDVAEGQVLIEARIVNVSLNDSTSLGIDWQQVILTVGHKAASSHVRTQTTIRDNLLTPGDAITGNILLPGAATGSAIQFTADDLTAIINALHTVGKTETLSNPRILVSNNQEAKILVGTKEAFITTTTTIPNAGSTTIAPEIKTEDVGTKLYVTPNIKGDGRIQLKIRPEVSSVARTIALASTVVPIVQTTEAETNVLVKSGVTIIIGGLITTTRVTTDNRVPWLGDLPIIGVPFRGQSTSNKKTELVVFLTPQIVLSDGSPYVFPPDQETKGRLTAEPSSATASEDTVPAAYRVAVRQRLQEQITQQFQAAGLSAGSVAVSCVLDHDGWVVRGDVTSPQGELFVGVAKRALGRAQPFQKFPEGFAAHQVQFRFSVDYAP